MQADTWRKVLPGDVLKKTQTGGLFQSTDPAADQPRLDTRELVPAGPLFGPEMPPATGEALGLEDGILAEAGITREEWARSRVPTTGTRRALIVYPEELSAEPAGEDALRISFILPKGSFATVLLREFMGDDD
jgi:tRNA pseudouridine13 synthase